MIANFDASNISINNALTNIPIKPPMNETTNANSTPLNLDKFKSAFLARLNIFKNIKIKERNPKIPTSPNNLKKSLSVAKVIEEYPVPSKGFFLNARSALGHSTFNLIDVDLSSKMGAGVGSLFLLSLLWGSISASAALTLNLETIF